MKSGRIWGLVLASGFLLGADRRLAAQELVDLELDSRLTPRFGLYHQTEENGFVEPYTDARIFVPLAPFSSLDVAVFSDLRLILDNDSNLGFNLGGGVRGMVPVVDGVWGVNVFADQRDTKIDTYNQVGFGLEAFIRNLELRQNFYFPVGDESNVVSSSFAPAPGATPFFRSNFLSIAAARTTSIEQALKGFDSEIGGPVPGINRLLDEFVQVRGYVGAYRYDNPNLENVSGVSSRINVNYRDTSEVNVFLQHDGFFGTQVGVGVALYLDKFLGQNFRSGRPSIRDHFNRTVQRRQMITIARGEVTANAGIVDLTNPATGQPLTITHVRNTNQLGPGLATAAAGPVPAAGSDPNAAPGTFENPLTALPNTQNTDIVYLHAGSVFNQQSYVLADGQRLVGEGGGFTHFVNTVELGTIALPGTGGASSARPVVANTNGAAVILGNNSEVANLDIVNPTLSGVFADNVTGALVNNVSVVSNALGLTALDTVKASSIAAAALFPMNVAGMDFVNSTVDIVGSTITTTGLAVPGILLDRSHATVTNTSITTSGDLAVGVSPIDGSVTLNNSTITTSGDFAFGVGVNTFAVGSRGVVDPLTPGSVNITLNNSTITTTGVGATGIGDANLELLNEIGFLADAPVANLAITVNDSTIMTSGDGAFGIGVGFFSGGQLALQAIEPPSNILVSVNRSAINTQGESSFAIAVPFGTLNVADSTLTVTGDFSSGIVAYASTVNVRNSTINASGEDTDGINGWELDLTVTGTTIVTDGDDGEGIEIEDSQYRITGSNLLIKSGEGSEALNIDGGSGTISGNTIVTQGESSDGVEIRNSVVTLTGNTITASGQNSRGVDVQDETTATISGNTIVASSDEIAAEVGAGDLLAVTITSNILDAGAGSILLDNIAAGTITVRGFANAAELALGNGISDANVFEIGTITYDP